MLPLHSIEVVVANWPSGWLSTTVSVANVVAFVVLTLYLIAINKRQSLMTEFQAFAMEREQAAVKLADANEAIAAVSMIYVRVVMFRSLTVKELMSFAKWLPGWFVITDHEYVQRLVVRVFSDSTITSQIESTYWRWDLLKALIAGASDPELTDPGDEAKIADLLEKMAEEHQAVEQRIRDAVAQYRSNLEQVESRLNEAAAAIRRKRGIFT